VSQKNIFQKIKWLLLHPGFKKHPVRTLYRVLCWEIIRIRKKPIRFNFDKTLSIMLYPNDGVSRLTYYFNYHEPLEFAFQNQYLTMDMICADVGANTGMYSLYMAKRCAQVFAFEPQSESLQRLQNNAKNTMMQSKTIYLLIDRHDSSKSTTLPTNQTSSDLISTDAISLDEYFKDNTIYRLDYLKIDAEGAEQYILLGAIATIKNFRPIIQIEILPEMQNGVESIIFNFKIFFKSLDYLLYHIDPESEQLTSGPSWNTIAVPNAKMQSLVQTGLLKK
jgi:FkbM family methyltransferase